jgi:hypothetical protein
MFILKKQTANTDGSQQKKFYPAPAHGGLGTILATGTFDGATISLEMKGEGTEWVTVADSSFTQAGAASLLGGGFNLRGVVANAGASTELNIEVLF